MKCLNCGNEFEGNYCPECGQSAKTGRFTLKFIIENLLSAIMGRDGGVWFTLKSLFTRPGQMIVENLEGKRKKYYSPFPMLFFALALYIIITSFTSGFYVQEAIEEAKSDFTEEYKQSNPTNVEAYDLFYKTVSFYNNHYTLCFLLTLPLYVIAARACFGKKNRERYYWAEYIVTIVYAMVIVVLFRCLAKLVYPIDEDLSISLTFLLPPLVTVVAFTACFKKMSGFSIAKTAWRSVLTVILYDLMLGVVAIIGIVIFAFVLVHRVK